MVLSKREKIGLIIFVIIILFFVSLRYFGTGKKTDAILSKKNESVNENHEENKLIEVYICGAVNKPGVYTLNEGDRLIKLLALCGGGTENANLDAINLSIRLKDEDYIRIPEKNSGVDMEKGNVNIKDEKVNINIAGLEELKKLPRIGDALANRIIEYRNKNGLFKRIEDIKNVSGIGEKMFENMKDLITVY